MCDKLASMMLSWPKEMQAALYYGIGDVRLEKVAVPQELQAGEILVKVGAALTCGTDLKAFRQGHPVLLGENYPAPFGHEMAGEIAAIGPGVTQFKPGQRVVCANSAPCDHCFFCEKGEPNLCDRLSLLNGAYAEYIKIPPAIVKHNTYVIPDHLPYQHAALSEPLACAVHAFYALNITAQDRVVVYGCGIMGLLFLAVAAHHGASIIAVGRNSKKLQLAKTLGAKATLNVNEEPNFIRGILSHTEGRGADFVLEAIGKPQAWEDAFAMVRKGGTVCLFGGCKQGSHFSLDTHRVHYQEITVKGVFHHRPECFAKAVSYIAQGIVPAHLFIDQTLRLEDLSKFYHTALTSSFFKAAVLPND